MKNTVVEVDFDIYFVMFRQKYSQKNSTSKIFAKKCDIKNICKKIRHQKYLQHQCDIQKNIHRVRDDTEADDNSL
jgi:hypothetical protein